MLKLKIYQEETLNILRQYLESARFDGPKNAFEEQMSEDALPLYRDYQIVEGLEDIPYVCLRLPTGGGKTLLAAYTIGIAADAYLEKDYPLVLWLVPTNTIREQTLGTLRKPGHPNREILERTFDGRLLVLDIADFVQIRPQDLRDKTCVIVGTLATLRVNSTEGRKVYAHNENLEPHFSLVPENTIGLERIEEGADTGRIKFSFRNLLALHQPLVLVDEAHNASTSLSFEVMQRINPACIVEFTATPARNSNILHSVSAAELKAEEMIKLPIILTEHQTWQEAIRDSILRRKSLQEFAEKDRDFIRPIVLIQAESKDRDITVEVVKDYLLSQEKIAREQIAVATGTQRELDGVNLLDPDNKVEFVITIQALKEGWDCPFAYVFCSVANVHSKKDVEQLLGRVLRMPYAKRRQQEELNQAYAYVSSTSWPQAIGQLHDRLVSMGFDEQEAEQFIKPGPSLFPIDGAGMSKISEPLKLILSDGPDLSDFDLEEQTHVSILPTGDDKVEVRISGEISQELESKLVSSVPKRDRAVVKKTIAIHRRHYQRRLSPSEKGEIFNVPQLCLWVDGELELVDKEWFLGADGWNLLDYPPKLSEFEFSIRETADSFLIDLKDRHLITKYLGPQTNLDLNDVQTNWTDLELSRWLDSRLRQPDIKQEILLEFLRQMVAYLTEKRDFQISTLVRTRYALEKALRGKIRDYRQQAYDNGYQDTLFGSSAKVETSYEFDFRFSPKNYPAKWPYNGSYQFNKHFYPMVGELKSTGEEFDCAQAVDRCHLVKYWVRNVDRQPDFSFWLRTATDRFYPDFVAKLKDERTFVLEYKGFHLSGSEDTKQKQNLGELWEEKSQGKGLFLMCFKQDSLGRDVYRQIEDKIADNS